MLLDPQITGVFAGDDVAAGVEVIVGHDVRIDPDLVKARDLVVGEDDDDMRVRVGFGIAGVDDGAGLQDSSVNNLRRARPPA